MITLSAYLIPLACGVIGGGGLVQYIRCRCRASASARWPTVIGTITESRLAIENDRDGDETYRADIRFAYRVGERDYQGSTVKWGWTAIFALRSRAAAVLAKYPAGMKVTVHYDPAQPRTAVLEPLSREGMGAPLVFAASFVGAGLIALKLLTGVV
jgi:hypothetical protein